MKARIKKTGEIVNVSDLTRIVLEYCNSNGYPINVKPEDVELIQEQTEDEHWQDVRERAAIAAMQGFMNIYNKETIARLAVEQADALIKELKKEK